MLTWLAAATLLMPRPEALRVSFKVFATTAQYGETTWSRCTPTGRVPSAVPRPAWAWSCSISTPAPAAASSPPRRRPSGSRGSCAATLDVRDAVELSGVLRAGETVGGPERTAAAALVLGEPLAEHKVGRLLDWLEAGGTGLSPRRRDELFDLVVAGRPDPAQLRALSRIAAGSDDAAFRERVRWQVFGVIVAMVDGRDPDGVTDAAQARRRLEAALAAASPEEVVTLLDLAADHAIAPNPARFADALHAFIRWWADGGLDVPDVDRWACGPTAVDLLRDELARRLTGSSAAEREATGDLWWRRLWSTIQDPRSPLDEAVAAAAMKHGDATVRSAVTRRVLDVLSRAEDVTDVAWSALFSRRTATAEDLLCVLAAGRAAGPPSAWTVGAIADMLEADGRPSRATLDVLVALAELKVDLGLRRCGRCSARSWPSAACPTVSRSRSAAGSTRRRCRPRPGSSPRSRASCCRSRPPGWSAPSPGSTLARPRRSCSPPRRSSGRCWSRSWSAPWGGATSTPWRSGSSTWRASPSWTRSAPSGCATC